MSVNQGEAPQITLACNPQNSFTITGAGGIPPGLDEPINSFSPVAESAVPTDLTPNRLVEAQGWRRNRDGRVDLVVDAPGVVPYGSLTNPQCGESPRSLR